MFSSVIYEDQVPKVFETLHPVHFSILHDRAFKKAWDPWQPRYFALREDSTIIYRTTKDSPILAKLDVNGTKVSKMVIDSSMNPLLTKEYGITVSCKDRGVDTSFRCILQESELQSFLNAIRAFVPDFTIDADAMPLDPYAPNLSTEYLNQSFMRQSLTKAMDSYDHRTKYDQIIDRRGAFEFLPVYFDNDMIHGSWWFVIGSLVTVLFTSVILANSYNTELLGEDDSNLSDERYRAVWYCILISGVLFTLGSLAFVRAMFKDPPLRPLFRWYHLQSDELLGSWLFFLGCLPFIPYCFVYLASERSIAYFGAFISSIVLNAGMFFFVLACYPGSKQRKNYVKPAVQCLCRCYSSRFIEKHLHNDWVAACWIVFWGTLVITVGSLGLTFKAIEKGSALQFYIYGTSFLELLMFTVGSAYFVAGSYPPGSRGVNRVAPAPSTANDPSPSQGDAVTNPVILNAAVSTEEPSLRDSHREVVGEGVKDGDYQLMEEKA